MKSSFTFMVSLHYVSVFWLYLNPFNSPSSYVKLDRSLQPSRTQMCSRRLSDRWRRRYGLVQAEPP